MNIDEEQKSNNHWQFNWDWKEVVKVFAKNGAKSSYF